MKKSEVSRREFLKWGGVALASAKLIGTTITPGYGATDTVPALKGVRRSVVIRTHEHFGDIDERLDFPGSWELTVVEMAGHDAPVLAREEIQQRLQKPIGSRPLREIAAGKKTAVITFDDLTRPTPTFSVAPLVVEELKAAGLADENILFMGSYGCHRNLEGDEVVRKLGTDLVRRYPWINHNPFDNVKDVGTTSFKNRIKVNQTFQAADIKITVSGIKVHEFAGYGGGGKAILPGLAWIDTIEYNHTVIGRNNKTAGPIKTFKNEIRLDMNEAAKLARVDFSVQIVYNGKRQVCGIFAGDIVEAHHAGCRVANAHYRTRTAPPADVVVANAYPQNAQGNRSVEWIARSVREGGSGVLVLQNPQGLSAWHFLNQRIGGAKGRTYFDFLMTPPPAPAKGMQLIVYSQYMDKQQANKFPRGTRFAQTWAEVVEFLLQRHKGDASVAVYPYAGIQHPEIDLDG